MRPKYCYVCNEPTIHQNFVCARCCTKMGTSTGGGKAVHWLVNRGHRSRSSAEDPIPEEFIVKFVAPITEAFIDIGL